MENGSRSATHDGYKSTTIDVQIKILNDSFAGDRVSFVLAGVDRTVDSAWYQQMTWGSANHGSISEGRYRRPQHLPFFVFYSFLSSRLTFGTDDVLGLAIALD